MVQCLLSHFFPRPGRFLEDQDGSRSLNLQETKFVISQYKFSFMSPVQPQVPCFIKFPAVQRLGDT